MHMLSARVIVICLFVFSCSSQEGNVIDLPQSPNRSTSPVDSGSSGIGQLTLIWEQAPGSADSFDVYFVADSKNLSGAKKVTSLNSLTSLRQSVSLTPKQIQAAEMSAAVGNQKCFYIVAIQGGTPSDASDVACIQLSE